MIDAAAMEKDLLLEHVRRRLGNLYVTDARGPNPWDRLPPYWGDEVEAVQRVNAR